MTLFNLLAQSARRYPYRGAVYLGADEQLTYLVLESRALRLARALRTRATLGDRIMIVSKNCVEFIEIMFATWAAGLVVVPVNARLHEREIATIVEDAEPAVIFASRSIARALAPLLQGAAAQQIVAIDSEDYRAMLEGKPVTAPAAGTDDLAWLFYTSGT